MKLTDAWRLKMKCTLIKNAEWILPGHTMHKKWKEMKWQTESEPGGKVKKKKSREVSWSTVTKKEKEKKKRWKTLGELLSCCWLLMADYDDEERAFEDTPASGSPPAARRRCGQSRHSPRWTYTRRWWPACGPLAGRETHHISTNISLSAALHFI